MAGVTYSFGAGLSDFWILKLDKDGNVQWQKRYGGTNLDEAWSIQQTSDGGYIVAGATGSSGAGSYDFWVLKLDRDGNVQWQKTYGGTYADGAFSIQQTSDGGYIVAGYTKSFGAGGSDVWVLKLDRDGNVQWQKTYGGTGDDRANSIRQTSDGGYIVAGVTYSFGAGLSDFWILKLDKDGNVQWQKTYGGTGNDVALSVQQTSDGGYIVAGETQSFGAGGSDVWVLKLDRDGNVQWQKTYGGTYADGAFSIQQTSDGGYIVAGYTKSFGTGNADIWVLKLDQNGNVQWQKTYGGADRDEAYSVQQTRDGSYIVAGETQSFGAGGSDVWVLKLDQNGDIHGCSHQRTSNATVGNTNAIVGNTNAIVGNTNATVQATNAQTLQVCYYSPPHYTLTINKQGTGSGTITSNPAGIDCGQTCSATYPSGTQVTLTATQAQGSVFASWGGDCSRCGNNATCQITMDANKTCIAVFERIYTLTINKQGTGFGTVTSNPQGIYCGSTCSASFISGTSVTLTAIPVGTNTFAGWSGDCSSCGNNTTCTIKIDSNKTCTATFNQTSFGSIGFGVGGGGGGGCSMGAGASPINAFAYLFLPMLVALRRFIRR